MSDHREAFNLHYIISAPFAKAIAKELSLPSQEALGKAIYTFVFLQD